MRFMGYNVLAILAAAILIYAIEFVIFGLLIPGEQYAAMVGLGMDQMHADRMPVGVIMPILSAIGLAVAIKWRNAQGAMGGLTTALIVAIRPASGALRLRLRLTHRDVRLLQPCPLPDLLGSGRGASRRMEIGQ